MGGRFLLNESQIFHQPVKTLFNQSQAFVKLNKKPCSTDRRLFFNRSNTFAQPIKDSSPADHDRSANESRSVTRRIMISYPMNQRLFTNRSKTLCQRTRDFSPTNQRLLTNQSRISHSNNQIFFYNRYNAFINLFRILSITIYTLILTITRWRN